MGSYLFKFQARNRSATVVSERDMDHLISLNMKLIYSKAVKIRSLDSLKGRDVGKSGV